MFDDKNANDARLNEESNSPEVKLNIAGRAASYGVSRLIDRPNIGDGRRNRRGRRGLDIDIPTGGIPGTRKPTGSRRDVDDDGWSDEGTTNPVWVGLPKAKKPQRPTVVSKPKIEEQPYRFRLSSGSGSKKLKVVGEDDARVKDLLSFMVGIPEKPKEEIIFSNEYTQRLDRSEELKRFYLNQRRFVEFTKPNGQKKLYMLQNTNDAAGIYAYDVDKLTKIIKENHPSRDFGAYKLEEPYRYKLRSAIAGAMQAGRIIGTRGKDAKNWQIDGIEVKKSSQRRGLGSAMLKFHRDTFPEYRLDHSFTLSEEGKGFAAATPVERLSSGVEKPRYPRKPTYGAFLEGADEIFGDAKDWNEFKQIYDDTEVVFLDYETTGLIMDDFKQSSGNGRPVQIGLTKMKGDKVIDKLDLFMNPEEPLGEWSRNNLKDSNGNRLSDAWLSTQMSISDAHKKVAEFIGDKGILGVQNAAFDKDVLEDALAESGIDWRPLGYLDTKEIADMVLPKWTPENQDGPYRIADGNKVPSNALADITKYLGVELGEKHHYASADAEAAGMVMNAIINGAIRNGWSEDVLDRNKRIDKLKRDRAAYAAKVKQFEIDKKEFLKGNPPQEDERLSSGGRQRPVIKMTGAEVDKIKQHRQRKYNYGDKSVLHDGKEIRRDRNDWLSGMTPEQMAEVLVPSSPEQQFEMWIDDFAPGARKLEPIRNAFKKYWDEFHEQHPWDRLNTSSESIQAMKETLREALESNPNMRWAFETHGAPMFSIWGQDGINKWEERPEMVDLIDKITKARGYKERAYVAGRVSPFIDLALFHPRAAVDRKSSSGENIPLSLGPTHEVRPGDSHIDNSMAGKIMHEWAHWLHFRAIRDYEGKTKPTNRTYYGSGKKNDPAYTIGLDIAQQYNSSKTNPQLMKLHEDGVAIDSDPNAPRTTTSYAHVSPAEMLAEAITAVLHPNREIAAESLNSKLKRDAELLLGGDGQSYRPWEEYSAKQIAIFKKQISSLSKKERKERLSSGKKDIFGINNRKNVYPRFESKPTQDTYKKGFSPKPPTLTRELNKDRIDIANKPISEFSYIDSLGKTTVLFGDGGKRNNEAYEFQMALMIANSLNFDSNEINEIFASGEDFGGVIDSLPDGKFYINVERLPDLKNVPYFDGKKIKADFDLEKVETQNISKFHGLKPNDIYVKGAGIRPDDHFVEFDSNTEDGQNILKSLVVKEFMKHWAIGTSRPLSRLMSIAAGQLFGGDEKVNTEDWSERQQDFARELLSSMYSMTQSYFDSKGITHLTLFRGLLLNDEQIKKATMGDNSISLSPTLSFAATKGNNLSSWTSDLSVAIQHAEDVQTLSYRDLGKRVLLKQIIPVEDVVGTNLFGFGVHGESEFVTIGKIRPTMIHVGDPTKDFDAFEMNDDDSFYANSKKLAQKLSSNDSQEDKATSKIIDDFVDSQNESVGRLSSGRVSRTKDAISKAFKFKIKKYKDREKTESETISFEPDKAEDFGVISPDASSSFAKEVVKDSANIINIGPGRSEGEEKRLNELYERLPEERPNEVFAKRAVSEVLAELVDEDLETLLSIFHTKESIVDIFPERHRETIRTALSVDGTRKDIPFGLSDEITGISKEDFDSKIKDIKGGWLLALGRRPNSDKERAILLDEKAQIRELIFRLTTGSVESDDDYKFRIDPDLGGALVQRLEVEAALRLSNINTVRARLVKAMSDMAFGGDGSVRPEKRLLEMFPNLKEALDFIDDGRFDSLSPELKIAAQIAIERMAVDIFEDAFLFDEDIEPGEPMVWPYVKIPEYHKQRMYDILTKFVGLTDDEMRMLGYYEDNNDFQNTMSSVVRAIRGSSNVFRKSNNYQIFYSVDADETESGKVKKSLPSGKTQLVNDTDTNRFENLFNIAFSGEELPEPKISDINDAQNKTGVWEPIPTQSAMREWESTVQRRKVGYQIKIINELFPKDYQGPRKVRILIGEHGEKGHTAYLFEDASKPSRYADSSPNLTGREIAFPDKSKWRTVEIELPYGSSDRLRDAKAADVIDEFFTKEHLRITLSDFVTGLKQADEYFGKEGLDKEILDTEEIEVSAMGRRAVEVLVNSMTKTKELDIRTPEGQKAIKQRLLSDVVRSWAASSNKVFLSTLVQEVAAEEFGLESDSISLGKVLPEEFSKTPGIFGVLKDMDEVGEKLTIPDQQRRAIVSILQAMRDATQEYFKEKGITHVTLYRGMQIKPNDLPKDVKAGNASRQILQMRPLSSWATNMEMAQRFSGGDGYSSTPGFEPRAGVIVSTVVPVEDILATPLTGFGCLNENEVVLLGKQREGVVHLSKASYQTSRVSGRAKGSPDWPTDQSKYDISQEKLNETILEYRDVLKETKAILDSYVDDVIKQKSSASSYEERLSSGLVDRRTRVRLDKTEIEKRSRDFVVEFDRVEDREGVAQTLKKAFDGGYTVQIDAYSDIKEGISVGRNEHGMILRAGEGFDADGNPEPWLVDMFLDWMRLHGPSTFEKPKEGATQVALGGWRTKDGKVYLDVVDIYPETPEFIDRAVQLGLSEDQIAVTKLKKLWELLDAGRDLEGPDGPFIYSGGRGGRTISVKTLRDFSKRRKELLERMAQSGSPDILQVGKTTRIELKNARNMKRIRAVDRDGISKNEFLLFDSPDGLSVTAYSGEQLASVIGDENNKKPTLSQIKRLLETQQPVAAIRINRGIDENVPAISYVKDEQIDIPGLFEALSRMHMQFNAGRRDKEDLRLSSGAKYPLHPDTNKYPSDSSGFGSMPGDPDKARVTMVPISLMRQYLEFDRNKEDESLPGYSANAINEIAEELKAGGGIREPLTLLHNREMNWAYMSEGNHRLAAAEKAGLTHVPVTVWSQSEDSGVADRKESGRGAPLTLIHPRMWARREEDTYVPKMITPALFAELQDDEDREMLKNWENEQTEQWKLSSRGKSSGRLSSGGSDERRREIGKLLSQKDTFGITASLRSIARDYADYRYEMNNDMADSLIKRLRSLPDRSSDEFGLSSGDEKDTVRKLRERFEELAEIESEMSFGEAAAERERRIAKDRTRPSRDGTGRATFTRGPIHYLGLEDGREIPLYDDINPRTPEQRRERLRGISELDVVERQLGGNPIKKNRKNRRLRVSKDLDDKLSSGNQKRENISQNFSTFNEPSGFNNRGTVWIRENKTGKAVGFIDYSGDFLAKVYVLPDYRRQGIASYLYDEAKKYNGGVEMRADDFTNTGAAFMSAVTGEEIYQSGDYSVIPQWESKQNKERLLDFEKKSKERLSSGDATPKRDNDSIIKDGPISFDYGRDKRNLPNIAPVKQLKTKFGNTPEKIGNYFYKKHGMHIVFDEKISKSSEPAIYGTLQAIDDFANNVQVDKEKFPVIMMKNSKDRFRPGYYGMFEERKFDARGVEKISPEERKLLKDFFKDKPKQDASGGIVRINIDELMFGIARNVGLYDSRIDTNVSEEDSIGDGFGGQNRWAFRVSTTERGQNGFLSKRYLLPKMVEDLFARLGWDYEENPIPTQDMKDEYGAAFFSEEQRKLRSKMISKYYANIKQRASYAITIHELAHALDFAALGVGERVSRGAPGFFTGTLDYAPPVTSLYGQRDDAENFAESFTTWFLFAGSPVSLDNARYAERAEKFMKLYLEYVKDSIRQPKANHSIKSEENSAGLNVSSISDNDLNETHPVVVFALAPLVQEIQEMYPINNE